MHETETLVLFMKPRISIIGNELTCLLEDSFPPESHLARILSWLGAGLHETLLLSS